MSARLDIVKLKQLETYSKPEEIFNYIAIYTEVK